MFVDFFLLVNNITIPKHYRPVMWFMEEKAMLKHCAMTELIVMTILCTPRHHCS